MLYSIKDIRDNVFNLLFIAYVFMTGCASEYQTSEMLSVKNSIDRSKALNIFSSIILGSKDASGFCNASGGDRIYCVFGCYGYDRSSEGNPLFSDKGISFKAWKKGKFIRSDSKTNTYEKEYFNLQINFENIEKARVLEKNTRGKLISDDVYCKGDYIVALQYKLSEELAKANDIPPDFGIAHITLSSKNDVDNLLGSLSLLAPQARIIKGFGF